VDHGDIPIDEAGLAVRVTAVLENHGVATLGDLASLSDAALRELEKELPHGIHQVRLCLQLLRQSRG
jgi:DNA-directed RNA polymerase alpha subunit